MTEILFKRASGRRYYLQEIVNYKKNNGYSSSISKEMPDSQPTIP